MGCSSQASCLHFHSLPHWKVILLTWQKKMLHWQAPPITTTSQHSCNDEVLIVANHYKSIPLAGFNFTLHCISHTHPFLWCSAIFSTEEGITYSTLLSPISMSFTDLFLPVPSKLQEKVTVPNHIRL